MTRLADVTGLDRVGFPVWQAVRPAGRSLSVHQGKGASHVAARIGALCEAIECDRAEKVAADGPRCAAAALATARDAPDLADYARDRSRPPPTGAIAWCLATDLVSGGPLPVPHESVSLDLTQAGSGWFERSSNGLAVGAGEDDAIRTALCEAIERDAVGQWDRSAPAQRRATRLSLETISCAWFGEWRERLGAMAISLSVFAPATLTGIPAFIVSIAGNNEFGTGGRRFSGTAVHAEPETALFKAMAEALQSRLTFIAGVRDDIMPSAYAQRPPSPANPAVAPDGTVPWEAIVPFPPAWRASAEALARAGYARIAMKRLDDGTDGIAVTKVLVPGLGSLRRGRRGAA